MITVPGKPRRGGATNDQPARRLVAANQPIGAPGLQTRRRSGFSLWAESASSLYAAASVPSWPALGQEPDPGVHGFGRRERQPGASSYPALFPAGLPGYPNIPPTGFLMRAGRDGQQGQPRHPPAAVRILRCRRAKKRDKTLTDGSCGKVVRSPAVRLPRRRRSCREGSGAPLCSRRPGLAGRERPH